MSRKIAVPALLLILGLLLGSGSVELIHRHYEQGSRVAFEQRARCKSLADKYVRENTNADISTFLEESGYSRASNSCFAGVRSLDSTDYLEYAVVDLLSGRENSIGSCNQHKDCGEGKGSYLSDRLHVEFKSAIDGTQPPPLKRYKRD